MGNVDKFSRARLLNPANSQFIGQERVNAEIFTAMEILGRKLERSEAERDRLTRRLAMIESSATLDEKTGKLYLPAIVNNGLSAGTGKQATPKWIVAACVMSSSIALFALGFVLFTSPAPALTSEQMALLNRLKNPQLSLAIPESKAWEHSGEEAAIPPAKDLSAPEIAQTPEEKIPDDVIAGEDTDTGKISSLSKEEIAAVPAAVDRVSPPQEADMPSDTSLPPALSQLEKRAYQGIPEAQHDIATAYAAGKGVAQDYKRAIYWFEKAADNGVANANYNLGVVYQQGLGVNTDMAKAISWYEKAAELGHPQAMYNLGIIYIEGVGTKTNIERGAAYFRRAANAGVAQAAYNLGVMYESNFIGAVDINKAIEWYKVADKAGHAEAHTALGRLNTLAAQSPGMADKVEPAAGGDETVSPGTPESDNNTPSE